MVGYNWHQQNLDIEDIEAYWNSYLCHTFLQVEVIALSAFANDWNMCSNCTKKW